jgi:starch synthase
MKILFAAAEVDPFSKVGGLADVASSLPRRLAELGHEVRVIAPCHAGGLEAFKSAQAVREISVKAPDGVHEARIATVAGNGEVPVDLVLDAVNFGREAVYGEPDDLYRYQFFCRTVLADLASNGWVPDVLHLNDWHTAPLAFGLRNVAWSHPVLRRTASVFTIHNLRYRGPDELNDLLCQAIYYGDFVTTVSPTYAREILTSEFGEGLDELLLLRHSQGKLTGILNGLDFDLYDPRTDTSLAQPFDVSSLGLRQRNRAELQRSLDLPAGQGPILGMVTRLTEQKGVDLALECAPEFMAAGGQLVVLGDGDDVLTAELQRLQAAYPGHVRLTARFDDGMARSIYAGSDMFLMPSRYEPCGLGQLMAMRYGAVPIGRRTGGLADTILDPADHGDGATGFLFDEFSPFALREAFARAMAAFRNPDTWRKLQVNGMSRDHSWRASATHYVEVYRRASGARGMAVHD